MSFYRSTHKLRAYRFFGRYALVSYELFIRFDKSVKYNFYLIALCKNVTICALVQVSSGENVVSLVPDVMPA